MKPAHNNGPGNVLGPLLEPCQSRRVLLIAVCYYSLKYVTLPLTQMRRAVNHIAKGKFDTPMPEVRHDDEISQLRDSLGNLQYSLSCYANDKKTDMSPETEGK